jgi:tetratricopeptide (TPR) repeat protein
LALVDIYRLFRDPTIRLNSSQISADELQARKLWNSGDIDQAITIYDKVRPVSARILKLLGQLFADEKHDYFNAIKSYRQALQLEEQVKSFDTSTKRLTNMYID